MLLLWYYISLHVCMVSKEKLNVILIFVPLEVKNVSPLAMFKSFSLYSMFFSLKIIKPGRVGGWWCLSRMVPSELPGSVVCSLTLIQGSFQSLLFQIKYLFVPFYFLLQGFPIHIFYNFCSCSKLSVFLQLCFAFFFFLISIDISGFPGGSVIKNSVCQCRRHGFNPWVGKTCQRKKWQSTPVFLSGKPYEQWSLVGYSPWGHKRDTI